MIEMVYGFVKWCHSNPESLMSFFAKQWLEEKSWSSVCTDGHMWCLITHLVLLLWWRKTLHTSLGLTAFSISIYCGSSLSADLALVDAKPTPRGPQRDLPDMTGSCHHGKCLPVTSREDLSLEVTWPPEGQGMVSYYSTPLGRFNCPGISVSLKDPGTDCADTKVSLYWYQRLYQQSWKISCLLPLK